MRVAILTMFNWLSSTYSLVNIVGTVNFTLTIRNITLGKKEFKMEIISDTKPELNHNSGVVQFKNSDLKVESFC